MNEPVLDAAVRRLHGGLEPSLLKSFESQVQKGASAVRTIAEALGAESLGTLIAVFALGADPALGASARPLLDSVREHAPLLAAQLESEAARKASSASMPASPADARDLAAADSFPEPFHDVDSLRVIPTFLSTREKLFPILRLDLTYRGGAEPTALSLRAHDVLFLASSLLEALGDLGETIDRLALTERVDDDDYGDISEIEAKLGEVIGRLRGPGLAFLRRRPAALPM